MESIACRAYAIGSRYVHHRESEGTDEDAGAASQSQKKFALEYGLAVKSVEALKELCVQYAEARKSGSSKKQVSALSKKVRALYSNIRDKHIIRLNRLAIARRGNAVSANEVEERGRMVTMLVYWLEEQDTIGEGIDFLGCEGLHPLPATGGRSVQLPLVSGGSEQDERGDGNGDPESSESWEMEGSVEAVPVDGVEPSPISIQVDSRGQAAHTPVASGRSGNDGICATPTSSVAAVPRQSKSVGGGTTPGACSTNLSAPVTPTVKEHVARSSSDELKTDTDTGCGKEVSTPGERIGGGAKQDEQQDVSPTSSHCDLEECVANLAKWNRDPHMLIHMIYKHYPPVNGKQMYVGGTMKKSYQRAMAHYHPDKQDAGGDGGESWLTVCDIICKELTRKYVTL